MTFWVAINSANRQLSSRYVQGESFMFKKCWEHIEKSSMASVVAGDQGRSNMVVRGTEVRGLDGGGRMVLSTKTCSIDRSRRDTSIEHGFTISTNQERL